MSVAAVIAITFTDVHMPLVQICISPQALAFFTKLCQQVEVPVLQLLLWICMHWASLFTLLDRLLMLKKV
jgi:hypothetical protein